jgi:hypothetical protein
MNMVRRAWVRSYHTLGEPLTHETSESRPEGREGAAPRIPLSAVLSLSGAARTSEHPGDSTGDPKSANAVRRLFIPLAATCLVAGSMSALAARERVVAMVPFVAPAYAAIGLPVNARGLAIQDVRARLGEAGEKKYLMIEGWIVNLRAAQTTSPDLRIALRGSDGGELYVWTARAPRRRLERAERVRFAARLEAPPEAANDVIVRFVDAGTKATPGAEGS